MRTMMMVAAGISAAMLFPTAAQADPHDGWRRLAEKERECARELRRADSPRQYHDRLRDCRRDLARTHRQLVREQWRDEQRFQREMWERRWDRDDDWDDDWDDE